MLLVQSQNITQLSAKKFFVFAPRTLSRCNGNKMQKLESGNFILGFLKFQVNSVLLLFLYENGN